jgi:hypothetical protein
MLAADGDYAIFVVHATYSLGSSSQLALTYAGDNIYTFKLNGKVALMSENRLPAIFPESTSPIQMFDYSAQMVIRYLVKVAANIQTRNRSCARSKMIIDDAGFVVHKPSGAVEESDVENKEPAVDLVQPADDMVVQFLSLHAISDLGTNKARLAAVSDRSVVIITDGVDPDELTTMMRHMAVEQVKAGMHVSVARDPKLSALPSNAILSDGTLMLVDNSKGGAQTILDLAARRKWKEMAEAMEVEAKAQFEEVERIHVNVVCASPVRPISSSIIRTGTYVPITAASSYGLFRAWSETLAHNPGIISDDTTAGQIKLLNLVRAHMYIFAVYGHLLEYNSFPAYELSEYELHLPTASGADDIRKGTTTMTGEELLYKLENVTSVNELALLAYTYGAFVSNGEIRG